MTFLEIENAENLLFNYIRRHSDSPDRVVRFLPAKWNPSKGFYVVVESDGVFRRGDVRTSEAVRVTVHAVDKPSARKLIDSIDSLLLTPGIHQPLFWKIEPGAGIVTTRIGPDSRVGGWVASATYNIRSIRNQNKKH